MCRVVADQAVALRRIRAGRHRSTLGVRIIQIHPETARYVDRDEPSRQQMCRDILVGLARDPACRAFLRDRGETMVRGDDHVGIAIQTKLFQ